MEWKWKHRCFNNDRNNEFKWRIIICGRMNIGTMMANYTEI